MDLSLTIDMGLVRAIMTEPDIWDRCAEDGVEMEEWYPGYDSMTAWLLCIEDKDIIGVILMHTDTSVSIKMHPYLRKEHREKGRKMMKAFYEWVLENTDVMKVNVTIPINQNIVVNFAKKVGFQKEGKSRLSYLKDGQLIDLQHLGITRIEIEEYLDGLSSTKETEKQAITA